MSTVLLLLITGLGLGALYFLVASGLSLIYGLMGVLNFAHGSFLTLGAFLGWEFARRMDDGSWSTFLLSILVGAIVGAGLVAALEPAAAAHAAGRSIFRHNPSRLLVDRPVSRSPHRSLSSSGILGVRPDSSSLAPECSRQLTTRYRAERSSRIRPLHPQLRPPRFSSLLANVMIER